MTVLDELVAFRAAHSDIDAVQVFLTDPSGVARGKILRGHELDRLFEHGRPVAGSILGLDVTGGMSMRRALSGTAAMPTCCVDPWPELCCLRPGWVYPARS